MSPTPFNGCSRIRVGLVANEDRIVAAYSDELCRTCLYSRSMGSATFETGLTLAHFVFEKKPFGSPLTHSLLEV